MVSHRATNYVPRPRRSSRTGALDDASLGVQAVHDAPDLEAAPGEAALAPPQWWIREYRRQGRAQVHRTRRAKIQTIRRLRATILLALMALAVALAVACLKTAYRIDFWPLNPSDGIVPSGSEWAAFELSLLPVVTFTVAFLATLLTIDATTAAWPRTLHRACLGRRPRRAPKKVESK